MNKLFSVSFCAVAIGATLLITGCGNKGSLVLPPPEPQVPASQVEKPAVSAFVSDAKSGQEEAVSTVEGAGKK